MVYEKSPHEILESLRAIIGQELAEKPLRRRPAIADPALWRAIQIQQKHIGLQPDAWPAAETGQSTAAKRNFL
jgi:hypothetical protein